MLLFKFIISWNPVVPTILLACATMIEISVLWKIKSMCYWHLWETLSLWCYLFQPIISLIHLFPMHPFSTPFLHLTVFWYFQGVEKGCIENKLVKRDIEHKWIYVSYLIPITEVSRNKDENPFLYLYLCILIFVDLYIGSDYTYLI